MFGHRLYLAILISTLFACIALRISSAREKESATRSISVSSIGSDIELIGRLGHPLGTMLSVDGNWEYPDQSNGPTKVYSIQLRITHVNQTPLDSALVLDTGSVHVDRKDRTSAIPSHERHKDLDGKRWSMRVYETGRLTKVPDEYWKLQGMPAIFPEPVFASAIVGVLEAK